MNDLLRKLPKVDDILRCLENSDLFKEFGAAIVTESIRDEIQILRHQILDGKIDLIPDQSELLESIVHRIYRSTLPSFRNVINGTGIILHTNLGRACLSEKAARSAADAARRYSNLEYNLEKGMRGSRYSHVETILCRLTGAESAIVVNNNAAAVLLILSAITTGGQVPVSRGELVEIGGAFRIPEIMEACGAQLKEVGATNKTHLYDYERAINENTRAIMKVHTSNYRIVGFSETPALADLVELGHRHGLPVIEDLGSGSLVDLNRFGIRNEPTVQSSVQAGVDVVCFSGDKLLGGPQAGIILGKKEYLDVMKSHPLARAMRVDKLTLAALEATLQSYENGSEYEIPVISMLGAKSIDLKERARLLASMLCAENIHAEVIPVEGRVGGGSVPDQVLSSYAVAIAGNVDTLEEKLRCGTPPIIGRIHDGMYLLDVRTLWDDDFPVVCKALKEAIG